MSRLWANKKTALFHDLYQCADRSRVLSIIAANDLGPEVQAVVQYQRPTLVMDAADCVTLAGPVVVGVRYCERFLSEVPHPLEIAAVFRPSDIFHPNASRGGMVCLGHPTPAISMEQILHLLWAAITFHMHYLNVRPGEIMNKEAAEYVRQHPEKFPLTEAGLFEAEPVG